MPVSRTKHSGGQIYVIPEASTSTKENSKPCIEPRNIHNKLLRQKKCQM